MKKAFVTGATGFLGVNLIRELLARNGTVYAMYLPSESPDALSALDVTCVPGDILDTDSLQKAIPEDHDLVIFHLAGDTSMWNRNAERQYMITVVGTRNVCRVALLKGIKKLVYTSSVSAYGYHRERVTESTVSNALSCGMNYNRTKYLAETEIKSAVALGLNAVILNPCNMLGPGDKKGWATLIISMVNGKVPGIAPGTATFAHVKDVSKAHIAAAEVGRCGENYLLGGVELSFKEVYAEINRILETDITLKMLSPVTLRLAMYGMRTVSFFTGREPLLTWPKYKRLTGTIICDDSKAQSELSFSTTSIHRMLLDTYQWLRDESVISVPPLQTSGAGAEK